VESREQGNSNRRAAAADRLWEFATTLYASTAVAAACLHAQDELGMDVNLILYAAWRASEGQALSAPRLADIAAACRDWQSAVVQPLRARRREWKQTRPDGFEYAAIKALELQAEKAQLELLASLDGNVLPVAETIGIAGHDDTAERDALLANNLRALCRHYDVDESALDPLRQALARA